MLLLSVEIQLTLEDSGSPRATSLGYSINDETCEVAVPFCIYFIPSVVPCLPQNLSRCLYIVPSARSLPPPGRSQSGVSVSCPSLTSDLIQIFFSIDHVQVVPLHHQRGWATDVPWASELCSLLQLQPSLLGLVRQEGQQKCGDQHFSRGVSLFRFQHFLALPACQSGLLYDDKTLIIY